MKEDKKVFSELRSGWDTAAVKDCLDEMLEIQNFIAAQIVNQINIRKLV